MSGCLAGGSEIMANRIEQIKQAKIALEKAVRDRGLDWPMPNKYSHPTDKQLYGYLEHAAEIINTLKHEHPDALHSFTDAIGNHIRARHAKMWTEVMAVFHAVPDTQEETPGSTEQALHQAKLWAASWLGKMCGSDRDKLDAVIELMASGHARVFWPAYKKILPKINQAQWDRIAPQFGDFELQKTLRYAVQACCNELADHGVEVWYPPPLPSSQLQKRLAHLEQEVRYCEEPDRESHIPYLICWAVLHLSQDQWNRLAVKINRYDREEVKAIIQIWQPEIEQRGLNPWLPESKSRAKKKQPNQAEKQNGKSSDT